MRLLLVLMALFIATPALADHNGKPHGELDTIVVNVDGMVCDFCARSLEKSFYQIDNVKGVVIDLDAKTMTLEVDHGTDVSDADIEKHVTYSGYKVSGIKR
jgi:copper chaperone CopZ